MDKRAAKAIKPSSHQAKPSRTIERWSSLIPDWEQAHHVGRLGGPQWMMRQQGLVRLDDLGRFSSAARGVEADII